MQISPLPSLFGGACFTICIDNERNVWSFGFNDKCKLGNPNNTETIFPPYKISSLCEIKEICCGFYHCICCDIEGNVFTFGDNSRGQLGISDNNKIKTHIPQKVNVPLVRRISCGSYYSICLTYDNKLYSFGINSEYQLGLRDFKQQKNNFPQVISTLDNIEIIECGGAYAVAKSYNDKCYKWGSYKEITEECMDWPSNIVSIKCGLTSLIILTISGDVYIYEGNDIRLLKNLPEIQRIECGYEHFLLVDINNDLWVFGENSYGQLGLGDAHNRQDPIKNESFGKVIDISSGGDTTFVRNDKNEIYASGMNGYYQIGKKSSIIYILSPILTLTDEYNKIWGLNLGKSRQKSARK